MKTLKKFLLLSIVFSILPLGLLSAAGGREEVAAPEPVDIEWWIYPWRIRIPGFPEDKAPEGTEFPEWVSQEFMKNNPNVNVKWVMVSNKEKNQKTAAAIAAGTTPNVQLSIDATMTYAKAGLLVPIGEYMTADDKQDFVGTALDYFTYNGKIWALPWAFGNNGMGVTNLLYPPMFEEAGIDWKKIVETGWTMDEFVSVGKKISKDTDGDGENDIFLTGFQGKTHFFTDFPWVYNHGGRLFNADETKITLDTPEAAAGFQFIVDAIYKHKIAPKGAEAADNYGVIQPFHDHKLAMGNGGPYEIGRIDRYVKRGDIEPFRPHVAPYPGVPGKKRGAWLVSQGFFVYKKQKNEATLQASADFARFVTGKEVMPLIESVLYISGRKSVNEGLYKTDDWLEFKPDIDRYANELATYGVMYLGSPLSGRVKISPLLEAAFQAIYARTKTPEKAIKDFVKEANAALGF